MGHPGALRSRAPVRSDGLRQICERAFWGFGITSGLTALTFTGGCLAVGGYFRAAAVAEASAGLCLPAQRFWPSSRILPGGMTVAIIIRFRFRMSRTSGGISNHLLGGWRPGCAGVGGGGCSGPARCAFLAAGVVGVGNFFVHGVFNWTVNGRSILPMAPAVGILLARRLEQNGLTGRKTWPRGAALCLAAGAALALLVTQSDFLLAVAVRQSARQVAQIWIHGREPVVSGALGISILHGQCGAWALDSKRSG